MYRLLIVDDEAHVVDWLYQLFQDIRHIEFDIYKAYSASSALKWMRMTKIDIVITDINMPKMNGLQLVEEIRSQWPECRVIFLTGYNEFDYVHRAIQKDVTGYVLKTDADEELINVVEKAVKQIVDSRKIEEVALKARQKIKSALILVQREFLTKMLESVYNKDEDIQKQFDELEIPIRAESPLLLLVGRIDNNSDMKSYVERSELLYGIEMVCSRFLSINVTCFFLARDNRHMVLFIQPSAKSVNQGETRDEAESSEKSALFVRDTLETIQISCRETLGASVSFVLGIEPVSCENIAQKYIELRNLMDCNMGFGNEMLMSDKSFNAMDNRSEITDICVKDIQLNLGKVGALSLCLQDGQKNKFHDLLDEITVCLRSLKTTNSNQALEIYFSISLMFISYINRRNLSHIIAFRTGLNKLMHIEQHSSWSEALDYLHNLANSIFDIQSNEEDSAVTDTISKIMQYVSSHLNEDLSLAKLADLVYFNPSYLSRLFKQVTGSNLTSFIFNMKAEKAKQLIEDSSLKIHEVALAVGYDSSTYFARFFKKMVGINPQEYRDSKLK